MDLSFTGWRFVLGGAIAVLSGVGCVESAPRHPIRPPVRWVLVERRAEELFPASRGIDPKSIWLRIEPVGIEDPAWEVAVESEGLPIELVSLSPGREAVPGETVTARVRLSRAIAGESYRLVARPSRPKVRILGPGEVVVRGDAPAEFRFTHLATGRAGITLEAVRVR